MSYIEGPELSHVAAHGSGWNDTSDLVHLFSAIESSDPQADDLLDEIMFRICEQSTDPELRLANEGVALVKAEFSGADDPVTPEAVCLGLGKGKFNFGIYREVHVSAWITPENLILNGRTRPMFGYSRGEAIRKILEAVTSPKEE
ncbi:MAG: hypothetical protein AAF413_03670 [Patescibacteria group bacterium]